MTDLTTRYLGLELRSPLVVGACGPLTENLDYLKRMEEAGAAAIVLHSLFEEQLVQEDLALHHHLSHGTESYAESLSYFPEAETFHVGPAAYLDHIRQAKEQLDIPIIASLNGATLGGWTDYARQIEQAGADALELNLYAMPTDLGLTGETVEQNYLEIVRAITGVVDLPVAVKLSPFFSNVAHFAKTLTDIGGINGLVLFNRFYQPDLDLENLEVCPRILLSTPQDMRLPLRWIAVLYHTLPVDFAATSGIHHAEDVVKMLMVGAKATMVVSALLRHGIDYLSTLETGLKQWMDAHEYESVQQLIGTMSQASCPNPSAYERAQYLRTLQTYTPAIALARSIENREKHYSLDPTTPITHPVGG